MSDFEVGVDLSTSAETKIESLRQQLAEKDAEIARWKGVFGHLGTADECGNEWIALQDRLAASESECLEQARLLGMSGEREAALLGKIERLEAENRKLRLDCLAAETQAQEH